MPFFALAREKGNCTVRMGWLDGATAVDRRQTGAVSAWRRESWIGWPLLSLTRDARAGGEVHFYERHRTDDGEV
jgi:hypothetical protein